MKLFSKIRCELKLRLKCRRLLFVQMLGRIVEIQNFQIFMKLFSIIHCELKLQLQLQLPGVVDFDFIKIMIGSNR